MDTGERRLVSVLFADVADSTAISETLGERSKFLMDEVVRLMSDQVEAFEGTVAQRLGDGLYAIFGAPVAHEDDPERAVRAALEIQHGLEQYARDVEEAYGIGLTARIGVNTGPVILTATEDPAEMYNALGDTANVASRLLSLAEEGGIVVGADTRIHIEDCFELEGLGVQQLKGRSSPVDAFRVICALDDGRPAPRLPIVGREFELAVLDRTLDQLTEGRGAIVSVLGEPGIGKTRLVAEVQQRYSDRVRFAEGRAASYGQNFPYWPIRDLLREWLGVGASTAEAQVRLELKARLTSLFGDQQAPDVYPFIATLMGLQLEAEAAAVFRELNPESAQRRSFDSFRELAVVLADERPLCLVFEDLHWADDSTLELIESLLQATEEAAVGLFLLYRNDPESRSWELGEQARRRYPHRHQEIQLAALPPDVSRVIVENAAEGPVPSGVSEKLTERAGGNPFFLEEALRDLIERGALERRNGAWELAVGEDELTIPAVVQGTLQARLDRLADETAEVLSIASVIGKTFGMPLLREAASGENLISELSDLQRLELIVETRRRPEPEYRFRHGLVQEVAYERLLEPKRRELHLRVGRALELLHRDSPEEVYGLLARHFTEADEQEKAADYLLKAGDLARGLFAEHEALAHYRRAREMLAKIGDDRRARDTLFKMALTYHTAFDFERAEDAYDEAFSCRVPRSARLERTETLETVMSQPREVIPLTELTVEGIQLLHHLFRGLLTVDRELNVLPAMADNFRVSGDGLTYLFRLREGMRWSDGVPVTADDFAYGWQRVKEEETVAAFLFDDIDEAQALDDRTLELRLREPRSYFPYILALPYSFPWPRHRCEELGDAWRDPKHLVGNGPFVLAEHESDRMVMAANPYWDGPHGNVRQINVTVGLSNAEVNDAWSKGDFDVARVYDPTLAETGNTIVEVVSELGFHFVGYRADAAPFSNPLVRKAFSHAVDRAALEETYPFARTALGGAIPPAMPGHSHRLAPAFDPELASRLLSEAGYPDGRGLPVLDVLLPHWLEPPEVLVDQWSQLGAEIRLSREGPQAICDVGEAHIWAQGWMADYPDPDGLLRGLMAHLPVYTDGEVKALMARARSLRDQARRIKLYQEIDRLWVSERAAILPLAYSRSMIARRPWIDGIWANPLTEPHLDAVTVRPKRS